MLRQIKATVHRDASVSARTATFAADAPAKAQNYGDGGRQQSNVISRRRAASGIQQWRNQIRFVSKQMADGGGSAKAGNVRFSRARQAAQGREATVAVRSTPDVGTAHGNVPIAVIGRVSQPVAPPPFARR